ncbi:Serine threonine kinase receptor associated [Paragonimus heterotremus]|uniref:Serine-threonine kinase receptor-associated protein n=1 Tax=Paragonimus heterotremus TaxID=100268 RepID=A0A8J4T1Z9_9TREM|nr:Serine threonine kinase receptor associated [Paragonimus heterotremus]
MTPSIKQAPICCPGHSRPVVDIHFSAETDCGYLFITAAKDGRAILRRGDTGDWIGSFLGHQGAIWSCVLDAHASKVATGAADFTAKLWDTTSGQQILSIVEDHIVRCVDLSKTDWGTYLLTANNRLKLSVYDVTASTTPLVQLNAHGQFIRRALWCDADRHALTAAEDATIKLWDLKDRASGPTLTAPIQTRQFKGPVTDVQFRHPAACDQMGEVQVAVCCGSTVQLFTFDWRRPDSLVIEEPGNTITLPCNMNSVSLHPIDNVLVCGGDDHYIYRVDCSNGAILETCKGHFGPVHCVRFSPDGRLFTSGSEDGTVRLWQTEVGCDFGLWQLTRPTAPAVNETSNENVLVSEVGADVNDTPTSTP